MTATGLACRPCPVRLLDMASFLFPLVLSFFFCLAPSFSLSPLFLTNPTYPAKVLPREVSAGLTRLAAPTHRRRTISSHCTRTRPGASATSAMLEGNDTPRTLLRPLFRADSPRLLSPCLACTGHEEKRATRRNSTLPQHPYRAGVAFPHVPSGRRIFTTTDFQT